MRRNTWIATLVLLACSAALMIGGQLSTTWTLRNVVDPPDLRDGLNADAQAADARLDALEIVALLDDLYLSGTTTTMVVSNTANNGTFYLDVWTDQAGDAGDYTRLLFPATGGVSIQNDHAVPGTPATIYGLDKDGIITLDGAAAIDNVTSADILNLTEATVKVTGLFNVTADATFDTDVIVGGGNIKGVAGDALALETIIDGTTGAGNDLTLNASAGNTTGAGGKIDINAGAGAGAGAGGAVEITAGADGTSGNGGDVDIDGGASTSGTGGAILLNGGVATAGIGGEIDITAGASGGANAGGAITITSGADGTSGGGGDINMVAGASTSGIGGGIDLDAGAGGTAGAGGEVDITAGNGAGAGAGGAITLLAGDDLRPRQGRHHHAGRCGRD